MSITQNEYEMIKGITGTFFSGRRKQLDLSQATLAEDVGVRVSTIQRIEYGKFVPGGETFIKLCIVLNLSLVFQKIPGKPGFIETYRNAWATPLKKVEPGIVQNDLDFETLSKKIGSFFRDQRKASGLTQQETADKAKLGLPTIQRIEYGNHLPDGKSLIKLCSAFNSLFFPIDFRSELLRTEGDI